MGMHALAKFPLNTVSTKQYLMAINNYHSTMDDHLIVNDWLDLLTNK